MVNAGFMALLVGCVVANLYYAQPLLPLLARDFGLDVAQAGQVAMLAQLGASLGLLLFVPLGDTCQRRKLITRLLLAESLALLALANAHGGAMLAIATFAVGLGAASVHVVVPFAASLAPEGQRGQVVGKVLAGLMSGILLARTWSGFLGGQLGWRPVFLVAAGLMLVLIPLVQKLIPPGEPSISMSYPELLKSIWQLARSQPDLREAAFLGAVFFCVFGAFWTSLAFLLEGAPFHCGSTVTGLFGLVGAAGAAGAPLVGRFTDTYGARRTTGLCLGLVGLAYLVLFLAGKTWVGLILGVLLLDFGVQSGHVSNQSRVYGLVGQSGRQTGGRLNTFYMVCYFGGGALGSSLAGLGWRLAGWHGVCGISLAVLSLGILGYIRGSISRR